MKDNDEYFGKDLEAMSFAQNYHTWILEEFAPYLGEKMAEIGAGMGSFSDFLLTAGVKELTAFEPSSNMFPLLEEKFSSNSNVETYDAFFEDKSHLFTNSFDSICYINVLEHIEDEKEAMQHAYNSLRPGGHLLIFVPALSFLYSDLDKKLGHFRRYSKKNLVETVSSAGFTIKKAKYFDIAGIIPWYLVFVLLKRIPTTSSVSAYDKLVVPIMKRVEKILTPPVGKNLVLIGQKVEE